MTADGLKERAWSELRSRRQQLVALSHAVHSHPELAYEEHRSSALLADALEEGGIMVERRAHGLDTAFRATTGSDGPHVVICAEFDALPEIGHACGHNIIGASAVGAGMALAGFADELGIKVTVLGTPAEEAGGGKIDLINAGAFDDVDVAMMVHPGPAEVVDLPTLAVAQMSVTFHGKESHASAFPEEGINALDAMNLSFSAIAALRQHITPTQRMHGIITHGGDAANVIPKKTSAMYYVRAETLEDLRSLKQRVIRCFEAGALATGCELELTGLAKDYERVWMNPVLGELYDRNLQAIGRQALPRKLVERSAGSTDMGNVSRIVPSIHPLMSIDSLPAVNHQAEFAAHCISPAGDDAVVDAAAAMVGTVIDLATTPGAWERLKEEFEAKDAG